MERGGPDRGAAPLAPLTADAPTSLAAGFGRSLGLVESSSTAWRPLAYRSRGWPWFSSSLREACLSCPAGCGRVARAAHRAPPSDRLRVRPSRPERRAEPRCPLRCAQGQRFHPPLRPLGARTLRRHRPPPAGRSWPPTSPPGEAPIGGFGLCQDTRPVAGPPIWARGVSSIRRCRGWPLAPAPAGPGRASRAGVSRPRLHADREGPRRGSPCPVAGPGACGLGRGGARARIRPPAGPASKRPHAVKKTEQATRGTARQEATQWRGGQSDRSPPGGQERRKGQAGAGGRAAIWPRSWPQAAATSRPLLQRTVTFMCAAARMPANALMRSSSGAARPAR